MERVKLGEYVKIRTGKLDANASSENGKYPFFTCSVTPLKIDTYSYDCECVLVAGNGDLNVKYHNGKFDAYQRTYIIESKDKQILTVPYLYCFLDKYVETLRGKAIGGVIKYIKLGNLTDALIPLPSIEEQEKIVEKLDKVSELIEKRKQQLEKLDLLIKSRFIEMFEYEDFPSIKLDDTCEFIRNGANIKQDKSAKGFPITRIETLSNDKFNLDRLGYANIFELDKYEKYILKIDDILISHINSTAYLGRAVRYRGESFTPIIHGMNLLCARIKKEFNATYIEHYFRSSYAKDFIRSITKQAVNQASISTTELKQMQIKIPPLDLQNEFAEFVKLIDKSKFKIQKSLEKLETLKKSLMQKYFESEERHI